MQSYNENLNFALWFYPLRTPSLGGEEALLEEGGKPPSRLATRLEQGAKKHKDDLSTSIDQISTPNRYHLLSTRPPSPPPRSLPLVIGDARHEGGSSSASNEFAVAPRGRRYWCLPSFEIEEPKARAGEEAFRS